MENDDDENIPITTMSDSELQTYKKYSEQIYDNIKSLDDLKILAKAAERTDQTKEITILQNNINKCFEKFEEDAISILGQLTEGVLIPKKLTIRNGRLYFYRRGYAPTIDTVLKIIKESVQNDAEIKNFVLRRLNKEKLKIINLIVMKEKEVKEIRGMFSGLGEERISLKKPRKIVLLSKEYGTRYSADIIEASGVSIRGSYLTILDEDDNEIRRGDSNMITSEFKDEIKLLKEKQIKKYNDVKKKIDNVNDEINKDCSKYLIASNFLVTNKNTKNNIYN